jgi:phosphoadenosine phosphosulfate reductase
MTTPTQSLPTAPITSPLTAPSILTQPEADDLNARFEKAHPSEIIKWAAQRFATPHVGGGAQGDKGGLVMTSSFGADSMCTIHLATQVLPDIKIILINTGYLFPETLAFMEETRTKYRLNIREYHTKNDPVVWLSINGEPDPTLRNNPDACCAANKDAVIDRAMADLAPAAFLRGVRSSQTSQRGQMKPLEWMDRYKAWAISPILRWSSRDVYLYMKEHNLPHHPLVDQGYLSIGCNPLTCTRPITAGEDERAGRWSGSDKKECGINLDQGAGI